jgi:hypothetical protein
MNQTVVVNVSEETQLKLYSSLKFEEERGTSRVKPGSTVVLEETGKLHQDTEGNVHKVFRLRKNKRNYYTLEGLLEEHQIG